MGGGRQVPGGPGRAAGGRGGRRGAGPGLDRPGRERRPGGRGQRRRGRCWTWCCRSGRLATRPAGARRPACCRCSGACPAPPGTPWRGSTAPEPTWRWWGCSGRRRRSRRSKAATTCCTRCPAVGGRSTATGPGSRTRGSATRRRWRTSWSASSGGTGRSWCCWRATSRRWRRCSSRPGPSSPAGSCGCAPAAAPRARRRRRSRRRSRRRWCCTCARSVSGCSSGSPRRSPSGRRAWTAAVPSWTPCAVARSRSSWSTTTTPPTRRSGSGPSPCRSASPARTPSGPGRRTRVSSPRRRCSCGPRWPPTRGSACSTRTTRAWPRASARCCAGRTRPPSTAPRAGPPADRAAPVPES